MENEKTLDSLLKDIVNEGIFTEEDSTGFQQELEALFSEMEVLITLDDETFSVLAPLLLDEFQKSSRDPNNPVMVLDGLKDIGMTAMEFMDSLETILLQKIKEEYPDLEKNRIDFLRQFFLALANSLSLAGVFEDDKIFIPVELVHENAQVPQYANFGDAGLDLVAIEDYEILPGETKLIRTGLKVAIPLGYALLIHPRSGLSLRSKMRVANSIGLIDSYYRDEIMVIAENIQPIIKDIEVDYKEDGRPELVSIEFGSPITIDKGQRFAQLRLVKVPLVNFHQVDEIVDVVENRGGGFGSTGDGSA